MAKEIVIWIADKPFDLDGEHYEEGDQWAQPPGWRIDDEASQYYDYPVFHYQLDQGSTEKQAGGARRPVLFDKQMVLPVHCQNALVMEEEKDHGVFVLSTESSESALEEGLPDEIAELLAAEGLNMPYLIQAANDERLLEVPGIGPGRLKKIREVYPYRDEFDPEESDA